MIRARELSALLVLLVACAGGGAAGPDPRTSSESLDAWGNPVQAAAPGEPGAPAAPAAPAQAPVASVAFASGGSTPGAGGAGAAASGAAAGSNVIGVDGIAAFDALPRPARDGIATHGVLFMHKSVGEDMVVASQALGLKWEYAGEPTDFDSKVLGSSLYTTPNGNPLPKMDEFAAFVRKAGPGLEAAVMKFGYADVETAGVAALQAKYEAMVKDLTAQRPSVRILHITPALTLGGDVGENKARAQVGEWMKQRFARTAVVFDLQAVESTLPDGTRCTKDGGPRLCEAYRYKGGGPNGPPDNETQGHLDPAAAKRIVKPFLYAIHRAFQLRR